MHGALSLVVLVLAAFSLAAPAAADPKVFGKATEVRRFSEEKLGKTGRSLFGEFQGKKLYFGAMYYNAAIDDGTFYRDVASLEAAMRVAESQCEALKGSGKGECTLYALILPKGFPADTFKANAVPLGLLPHFDRDFLKREKKGLHAAYAMSPLGLGGASWEWDTAQEAAEAATLSCLSDVAAEIAKMDKRTRDMVQARGYADCPVVAVRGP